MNDLYTMLNELCGTVPESEFRFFGTVQPLAPEKASGWRDVVGRLLAYARGDNASAPHLCVQLGQAPDFFSVSVYADNNCFGSYLDEYPADILIRLAKLGIVSSDVDIHASDGGSGIMISI